VNKKRVVLLSGLFTLLLLPAIFVVMKSEGIGFSKTSSLAAKVAETPQAATYYMVVHGSGNLEVENGRWFIRGACQPEVELGAIGKSTAIRAHGISGYTIENVTEFLKGHYLGNPVTVIAHVVAEKSDGEVFRVVRTTSMDILRHSDGRAEQ